MYEPKAPKHGEHPPHSEGRESEGCVGLWGSQECCEGLNVEKGMREWVVRRCRVRRGRKDEEENV